MNKAMDGDHQTHELPSTTRAYVRRSCRQPEPAGSENSISAGHASRRYGAHPEGPCAPPSLPDTSRKLVNRDKPTLQVPAGVHYAWCTTPRQVFISPPDRRVAASITVARHLLPGLTL